MHDTDGVASLVTAAAARIFRHHCDPRMRRASSGESAVALWRALEDAGMPRAWVPEAQGGVGLALADGFDLLALAGRFAVPAPLAETMLAGWLLARAGLGVPAGVLVAAPLTRRDSLRADPDGRISGTVRAVPFASHAAHFAVIAERDSSPVVALIEHRAAAIVPGLSIAGEPKDEVTFRDAPPVVVAPLPEGFGQEQLMLMGAAVRARQMAGALAAVLALAVDYARERVAFEKPIGRFQAVQHILARLAGEVAAAEAASSSAADAIAHAHRWDDAIFLEVAAAKIRVGEAAGVGAAIAHQVFGAMGFTDEHCLHLFTRRLWAWRDDFGSESEWAVRLGERVAAGGADSLWPLVAAR
jgi:acyl-CoA dehydrogenase